MIKYQMFIAAALLVGVAIGYFVKTEPIAAEEPAMVAETPKKAIKDKGEEATIAALRHRIAELERLLAEKQEKSTSAVLKAVTEATKMSFPEPPQAKWRELQKTNPERFAQITNRMAQWRSRHAEWTQGRIDFLSSIDTSSMNAEAKKTHEELQELFARREEIERQAWQMDLSSDEFHNLMAELHTTHGTLMRLSEAERNNLFVETARNLGLEGEDVKMFTDTIQQVIEVTDGEFGYSQMIRHHRGRGPQDGGPRGPGGPGGR